MSGSGILGLVSVLLAVVAVTIIFLSLRLPSRTRALLVAGLWIRVFGSLSYLYLIGFYYHSGDYGFYYREGLDYADQITSGNLGAALAPWVEQGWWGTSALIRISGIILSVIGPSLPGIFIVFGLISYLGIVSFWLAFARSFPNVNSEGYLAWLVFFPSLWFWPAALGKDAIGPVRNRNCHLRIRRAGIEEGVGDDGGGGLVGICNKTTSSSGPGIRYMRSSMAIGWIPVGSASGATSSGFTRRRYGDDCPSKWFIGSESVRAR